METKGGNILVLREAGGKGRGIKHNIDLDAVRKCWRKPEEVLPDDVFFGRLVDLTYEQDFKTATDHHPLKTKTDTFDMIEGIEGAAESLLKYLELLRTSVEGKVHFEAWARGLPSEGNYPEMTFFDSLQKLSKFRDTHYRVLSPKTNWHAYITQIEALFDSAGQKVKFHEDSLFLRVLKEIETQFPGLVFPPRSSPAGNRLSYVRSALGRK